MKHMSADLQSNNFPRLLTQWTKKMGTAEGFEGCQAYGNHSPGMAEISAIRFLMTLECFFGCATFFPLRAPPHPRATTPRSLLTLLRLSHSSVVRANPSHRLILSVARLVRTGGGFESLVDGRLGPHWKAERARSTDADRLVEEERFELSESLWLLLKVSMAMGENPGPHPSTIVPLLILTAKG